MATQPEPGSFMASMREQGNLIMRLAPLGQSLTLKELHRYVAAHTDSRDENPIGRTATACSFLVQGGFMAISEHNGELAVSLLKRQ